MSQLRARVEQRIQAELDKTNIKDVPDGTPARTGIANPTAHLAVSAYQEEVETWLRDWRSKSISADYAAFVDELLEDFRS